MVLRIHRAWQRGPATMPAPNCPTVRLLVARPTAPAPAPDKEELLGLEERAKKKIHDLRHRHVVTKGFPAATLISWEDLLKLYLAYRVGAGRYLAADGSKWDLLSLSIDRVDNRRGYEVGNLRLILRAHNTVRAQSNHDEGWIAYLESIDGDFVERQAAAVAAHTTVPAGKESDEDADERGGEREVAEARGGELAGRVGMVDVEDGGADLVMADAGGGSAVEEGGRDEDVEMAEVEAVLGPAVPAPAAPAQAPAAHAPAVSEAPLPHRNDIRGSHWRALPPNMLHPAQQYRVGSLPFQTSVYDVLRVTTTTPGGKGNCQLVAVLRAAAAAAAAAGLTRPDGSAWDTWDGDSLRADTVAQLREDRWRAQLWEDFPLSDHRDFYAEWVNRVPAGEWGNLRTLLVPREIVDLPLGIIDGVTKATRALQWPVLEYQVRLDSSQGIGGPCITLALLDERHFEIVYGLRRVASHRSFLEVLDLDELSK